jgi:hypothetical protein
VVAVRPALSGIGLVRRIDGGRRGSRGNLVEGRDHWNVDCASNNDTFRCSWSAARNSARPALARGGRDGAGGGRASQCFGSRTGQQALRGSGRRPRDPRSRTHPIAGRKGQRWSTLTICGRWGGTAHRAGHRARTVGTGSQPTIVVAPRRRALSRGGPAPRRRRCAATRSECWMATGAGAPVCPRSSTGANRPALGSRARSRARRRQQHID